MWQKCEFLQNDIHLPCLRVLFLLFIPLRVLPFFILRKQCILTSLSECEWKKIMVKLTKWVLHCHLIRMTTRNQRERKRKKTDLFSQKSHKTRKIADNTHKSIDLYIFVRVFYWNIYIIMIRYIYQFKKGEKPVWPELQTRRFLTRRERKEQRITDNGENGTQGNQVSIRNDTGNESHREWPLRRLQMERKPLMKTVDPSGVFLMGVGDNGEKD